MTILTRLIAGALALALMVAPAYPVPQGTPAPSVPTGAYTAYTPTAFASSNGATPPVFGTITGRYQVTGKRVDFSVAVPMTSTGTGSGNIQVSLPLPAAAQVTVVGLQSSTARQITGLLSGSSITLIMTTDQSYPGANSTTLYVSGSYEAQ